MEKDSTQFTSCETDAAPIAKLPKSDVDSAASKNYIQQDLNRWYRGTGVNPERGSAAAYIYGRCAFQDMADAVATANHPSHRVYILGWFVEENTILSTGTPPLLLRDLLKVSSAQIRGMFWKAPNPKIADNSHIVTFINSLKYGAAILDENLPFHRFAKEGTEIRGVHHQKLLVVSGSRGLIAFTGGMDINNSRVNVSYGGYEPLHDVHVRVTGSAAKQLLRVFSQRWLDHLESPALDSSRFKMSSSDVRADFDAILRGSSSGDSIPTCTERIKNVQSLAIGIGRTFANLRKFGREKSYSFAPYGEQTAWRLIENGVRNAKYFIYVEDQYFVSRRLKDALLKKLREPQFQSLIILTQNSASFEEPELAKSEFPFLVAARNEIRTDFLVVDPKKQKWKLFFLKQAAEKARQEWCGSYVHSKVFIFDDECAIIGTVNADNRGYTFDTEIAACITDDRIGRMGGQRFARDLRVNLWHKHLAVSHKKLVSWKNAVRIWEKPPAVSMVADASELEDSPLLGAKPVLRDKSEIDRLWTETIDPDTDLLP